MTAAFELSTKNRLTYYNVFQKIMLPRF